jgi:hypothetical protein
MEISNSIRYSKNESNPIENGTNNLLVLYFDKELLKIWNNLIFVGEIFCAIKFPLFIKHETNVKYNYKVKISCIYPFKNIIGQIFLSFRHGKKILCLTFFNIRKILSINRKIQKYNSLFLNIPQNENCYDLLDNNLYDSKFLP